MSSDLDQLRDDVVGVAQQTSGPLGTSTLGRVTVSPQRLTGTISQADANRRAARILPTYLRAWRRVTIGIGPTAARTRRRRDRDRPGRGHVPATRVTEVSHPLGDGRDTAGMPNHLTT